MPISRTGILTQVRGHPMNTRNSSDDNDDDNDDEKEQKIVLTITDVYLDRSRLQHEPISATLRTDLGASPLFFGNTYVTYKNGEN